MTIEQQLLEASSHIKHLEALLPQGVTYNYYSYSLALHDADVIDAMLDDVFPSNAIYTAQDAGILGRYKKVLKEYASNLRNSVRGGE